MQENYKAMMEPFEDTLSCMFTADMYFEFTAKGVAMGNAVQELKDVADFVTDSNEEDGIEKALNKFLPEN